MTYTLKCGTCLTDNNVSATDEPITWICISCTSENTSSLPRALDKSMVTDYTKASSLLSPVNAGKATNVVTAVRLVDYEKQVAQKAEEAAAKEAVDAEVVK